MGYNLNDSQGSKSDEMYTSTSDHMTFLLLDYMTKSAVFTRPVMMCQSVITFQRLNIQKISKT